VRERLTGAARASVAAKLATVYLLDSKPAEALRVLRLTQQAMLPRDLERERTLLEARAHAESGRADLALELLRDQSGADVERLKADALWQGRRWQQAGEQLERVLAERWRQPAALDAGARQDALRAAIAFSLAEDQLGLDRLRGKYLAKMSESLDAYAFDVVTRPIALRGAEFSAVLKDVSGADTLKAFLADYRARYFGKGRAAPSAALAGASGG
jgi:hypothetical protein